eukprot:TRINITY_DN1432_c0_g1_i10.p1 TRINITY_DN1432_c0_g1~~TRINITY_DN1432_c0_g1_i10.p1  ORF type:complete len:380 (+),score=66.81 TRINITY_DN1432_c0_g1_i10:426-1565(+)
MKANNSEKIWYIFQHFSPEKQEESGPEKLYFIKDSIGSGAFAVVKLAIEKKTGQRYAIKIIDKKKFSMNNRSRKDVIMDEVNILMKVKHPNIIFIKEVFDSPNQLCIVLELSNGGELFDRIVKNGRFSEERCQNLFYQMLLAVEYLHSVGISHRDLKPENILLQNLNDDVIKISDFGLSRIIGEGSFMKTLCGTPQYLAPEILTSVQKEEGYGKEVDLWSLGVILYILLCGYHPFDDTKPIPVLKQIRKGDFSFPEKDWGSISDSAKDLVRGLMTVEPSKRLTATQALNHPWMLLHPTNHQRMKQQSEEIEQKPKQEADLPLPQPPKEPEPTESSKKDQGAHNGSRMEQVGKAESLVEPEKEERKRKAGPLEAKKKAKK